MWTVGRDLGWGQNDWDKEKKIGIRTRGLGDGQEDWDKDKRIGMKRRVFRNLLSINYISKDSIVDMKYLVRCWVLSEWAWEFGILTVVRVIFYGKIC